MDLQLAAMLLGWPTPSPQLLAISGRYSYMTSRVHTGKCPTAGSGHDLWRSALILSARFGARAHETVCLRRTRVLAGRPAPSPLLFRAETAAALRPTDAKSSVFTNTEGAALTTAIGNRAPLQYLY